MEISLLKEPDLQFADGVHIDIRAGISTFGALDRGARDIPCPIRVGIVGTPETLLPLQNWIDTCAAGVHSDETRLRDLRPDFPGVKEDVFGTRLETSEAAVRSISRRDMTAALKSVDPIRHAVDLFMDHARDITARGSVNVVIIAPPAEIFKLGESRASKSDALDEGSDEQTAEHLLCFHDLYKARSMDLTAPSQVIRPDTYGAASTMTPGRKRSSLQDEATRAWNFCTALYYKAGAVPWRLVRHSSSLSACFVGVSFFRTVDQRRVLASVAQVFDERGEGVVVQGGNARIDKNDRSPHLTTEDAARLITDALAAYRREHRTLPARLVVHKTSYFDNSEREGMITAAESQSVEVIDLISVRRGGLRLFRDGTYPVLRGTTIQLDESSGAVYLRGSVPQFQTYPGMYVPAPLEFARSAGESSSRDISAELLQLSKLNFNNTQFDGGEPVTVRAARRVGDILKHIEPGRSIQSRFRFFT
jgi:hypothetical protein